MTIVRFLIIAIAAIPLALVATLLLLPFWRWFEATAGIESIGHSGPAEWCYLAVYAVVLLVLAWLFRKRR